MQNSAIQLNGNYDPLLVILSLIIACVASFAAFNLTSQVHHTEGRTRILWLTGGAIAMGAGIWAMHFVAILALKFATPVKYDLILTLTSVALAIGASWLALLIASRDVFTPTHWIIGGVCMGLAISGMHYIGMAAMRMPVQLSYNSGIALLSICIAIIASMIALKLNFYHRHKDDMHNLNQKYLSALFMGGGISGMHYSAMYGTSMIPLLLDSFQDYENITLYSEGLVLGIAFAVIVILFMVVLLSSNSGRIIIGIREKLVYFAMCLVLVTSGMIGAVFFQDIKTILYEHENNLFENEINIQAKEISGVINTLRDDVLYISQLPAIAGLIRAKHNGGMDPVNNLSESFWKNNLADSVKQFLLIKSDYFKVRLIGVEDTGKEIVRVERKDQGIIRIDEEFLESKVRRPYFINTIKLQKNEVNISDITLSRDYGEISFPRKPTIRASVPIFSDNGNIFGVVVISVDFDTHLYPKEIHQNHIGDNHFITNESGDYLYHSDPAKTFGFELGERYLIQQLHPQLSELIDNKDSETESILIDYGEGSRMMYLYKLRFDELNPQRYLILAEAALSDRIFQRSHEAVKRTIFLTIILFAVAAWLSLLISRVISDPIKNIAIALDKYTDGHHTTRLPDYSKGEIGVLTRAFNNMITQVEIRNKQIENNELYLRKIVENTAEGIITIDCEGIIRSFNQSAELLFGYTAEEVIGENVSILMPEPYSSKHNSYMKHYFDTGVAKVIGVGREVPALHKNGDVFPIELSTTEMITGSTRIFIGTVRDISDRKKTEEELRLAALVMDSSLESVIILNADTNIKTVNRAFTKITGYKEEEMQGENPNVLFSGIHNKDFIEKLWRDTRSKGFWQGEIYTTRKNGEEYPIWMSISTIKSENEDITNYVLIFIDITERKLVEDKLEHLAHYDSLTKLPNRLLFQDRLKQSIEHSRRNNKQLALLFLDLDRFKFVNDTYGHDIGDLLLVEVTKRLEKSIREVDTIARLGGDEFTIILEDINKPYNATNIARQIIESMSMPYYIKGHECFIGASIGISIYPTDSTDSKALAKYADIAMYRAKERGKNCYQEFNQAMSANIARRINTETQLRHAIERNEFVLHYQPQYNTFSGELIGVEALLRWRINDEELISPDEFVPILEDSGLITPVGEWVLHEACQQHLAWKKKFKSKIRIAINISPKQLVHKNIITTISSILDDNFMEPNYLELEITENALMEYPDLAIPILQKLNNMDIQLSIDDFGTGYSSLGYLKQLPIHSVKIDRSFIRDIPNDQDDVEIVRAIISMGHSLNLGIVAEGVENEEQLEFLKKLDCDIVQGFLFNQPLTVDKINELLDPKVNTTWFNVIKYKKQ